MANKVTVKMFTLSDNFKDVLRAGGGEALNKAALAGGHVIEGYAKVNANEVFSGKATNTLAGSIQTVLSKSGGTKAEVDVGPSVVYGRIHELGGFIKPIVAQFLHFFVDGVEVFTKLVHMPARPYLRPAVDEHESDILDAIGHQLKSGIAGAAK